MITNTITATSLNQVELSGANLLELLEGVITHVSKDNALHTLNAVQVEGSGGGFIARATDRFRLIEGSIHCLNGNLDTAVISLEDTKRVISLVKSHKANLIQFNRAGIRFVNDFGGNDFHGVRAVTKLRNRIYQFHFFHSYFFIGGFPIIKRASYSTLVIRKSYNNTLLPCSIEVRMVTGSYGF